MLQWLFLSICYMRYSYVLYNSLLLTAFLLFYSIPLVLSVYEIDCYPAPLVLQIILISVKLNEGTDSDILMFFTAECLNRYLLVLSYQSYKNSRYLPDQSLTPRIINNLCNSCLLIGDFRKSDMITAEIVMQAINNNEI